MSKAKTKEEILEESLQYKKENEEILDAFRKEYGKKKKKNWVLRVKCLKHNHIFDIMYQNYKKGQGCKKCSTEKQTYSTDKVQTIFKNNLKPNETFIKCFRKTRKNGNKEWWARLNCNKHGEFDISLNSHKRGSGCPKCKSDKIAKLCTLSKEQVEQDFFSHLKENEKLIKVYQKKRRKYGWNEWWGTLLCSEHGKFEIRRSCHIKGKGCPKCRAKRISETNTFPKERVEQDFRRYLKSNETLINVYQKRNINNHNVWYATLLCDKHGKFEIEKQHHKAGKGCPKCSASKGEARVREHLTDNNITFEEQYKFKDCKYKLQLPFDFYISSLNLAIEYQGIQHYEPVDAFGGEKNFKIQQKRDKIKREYCEKNNIKLLEIPYTEYDNVEKILSKELKI